MMPVKKTNNGLTKSGMLPDFFDNIDRFFDNDFLPSRFMPGRIMQNMPATNIRENDKNYQIEVAAPGLKKDDFKIEVENGAITISSEKEDEKEEKDENFTRREYNFSSFTRSFRLPETVKEENIDASYKDGVLTLTIPKKETTKPQRRQINIK